MKNQRLLGVWILVGSALVVGVLAIRDSSRPTENDIAVEASTPLASVDHESITTIDAEADATAPSTAASSTTVPSITSTTAAPTTTLAPDAQDLPTSPAELALALNEAEMMIRSANDPAPWGRRQQQLYRVLSANREWADETIDAIDEILRPAVELNWEARLNLSALVSSGSLSTILPAWRISAPLPADELIGYYESAEAETGVPWEYLAAINLVETRMGRIEGLSTAGATGPMQFLPSTWAECCEGDPTVDEDAILGAAVYLTIRGAPSDMAGALRGYNNSARYVNAVTAYANVLEADPDAYAGYHAWDVYFLSAAGLVRMPVGYNEAEPVDAAEWIAANPDALID